MRLVGRALLLLVLLAATFVTGLSRSGPATYAKEVSQPGAGLPVEHPALPRDASRPAASLAQVGPVVPLPDAVPGPGGVTSWPAWYKDSNGLALTLCLDGPPNCLASGADMDPDSSTASGEAFWWVAEVAGMPVGSGTALLVLAMEAAFGGDESVRPGGESSFGRIRIKLMNLTPGATYVVTHPFGQRSFVAEAGPVNVFFTEDIGCIAIPGVDPCATAPGGDFSLALSSNIGPFLTWDPAVAPAPPAGFIGDGATPHKVVGSPTGNNFFRVAGPEGTFTSDLFVVQGKRAVDAINDTVTVPAGATGVPIAVFANDIASTTDTLVVSAVTQPTNGSSTDADTHVTYTNNGTTGADSFTYTASNGAVTDVATVNVTAHAGNTPPVAVNDAATVPITATATTINVLSNDSDANSDLFFVSAITQGTKGVVAIGTSGRGITYDPSGTAAGADSFTYTVSDGLATSVGTVNVTVNTAPAAANDAVTITANTVNNAIDVLVNDTDADGNVLTVNAVTQPVSGTVAIGTGGANVLYTPNPNSGGVDPFTYTISDGAATSQATVAVTVNRFPVAASDAITVAVDSTNNPVAVLTNDRDPDGNALSIIAVSQPARGTTSISTGNIIYSPSAGIFGTDPFTYTISDGLLTSTATVTTTVNRPPAAGGDVFRIPFGSISNTITVLANDSDPDGNAIAVTDVTQPTHGETAVGTGGTNVVYTPHSTFAGQGTFTYTISDGHLTAPGTVTVTVHRGPAAGSDSFRIAQNSLNNVLNVMANDSDPEGDAIAITVVTQPTNGVVSIGTGGADIVYTPDAGFFGGDSFTYTVSDGQINATAGVTILVNRAPLTFGDVVTLQRNTVANPVNVLGNDRDPDGDALTITAVTQPASGVVSIGPVGLVLLYTANAGFTGTDSFSYTITDGQLTASGSVAVNIPDQRAANTAPLAVNDSATVPRNSSANAVNALANDADQDGDSLRVIAVGTPVSGVASIASDGSILLYTPNRGFSGSDSFTYTITDGPLASTATVNVSIPANIAPAAVNDTLFVARNSVNNPLQVLGNDADPDNDPLLVTVVGAAANGTAAVGPGGTTVIYTPRPGFDGTDSFTYSISDGALTANATVSVTVHSLNHAPVALKDNATVFVSSGANRIEVLSNDSDPDGDPVSVLPVISQPANGTATAGPGRGSILYTPAQGFSGTETFTYTVTDGDLSSPEATVTVSVRGVKLFMPIVTQNFTSGW